MKKKILLIAIFVFIVLTAGIIFLKFGKENKNQVCFKNNCFAVELAQTNEEKIRGLMFREKLDKNKGMLFLYDKEGIYPFWMKNTLIPLDIIWIDKNNKVVFINKNSQPCEDQYNCLSINPNVNAKYVLEINAGISDQIGLNIGDEIIVKK